MEVPKQQARIAGLLYLLVALSAPLGLLIVPSEVIVSGDATATAEKIRNSVSLVRAGIASELVHQILAVFLVLALSRLFKPTHEALAKQLVIFGALLSVPIVFVNVLNEVAALTLVSDAKFLSVIPRIQLDALAYLFVRLHEHGIIIASVFWGLWLFPFGLLVIKCGFIPKALGVLLILAGLGYLVSSFTSLIAPSQSVWVTQFTSPLQYCELPIILWLLIWGAKSSARALPMPPSDA